MLLCYYEMLVLVNREGDRSMMRDLRSAGAVGAGDDQHSAWCHLCSCGIIWLTNRLRNFQPKECVQTADAP